MKKHWPFVVPVIFLWIGFVCAISFMEAWLKFQAPGITVPLGLGIGRLVFGTLNKIEWVFALAILIGLVLDKTTHPWIWGLFALSFVILLLDSFWLLPALDARAAQIIDGELLPPSNLHLWYEAGEIIKCAALLFLGLMTLHSGISHQKSQNHAKHA